MENMIRTTVWVEKRALIEMQKILIERRESLSGWLRGKIRKELEEEAE